MKSTWFGQRNRYDFARLLKEADYSRQHYDTFRTFLTMSECFLRQGVRRAMGVEICPELEKRYMQAVAQVKHPKKISEAFMLLTDALDTVPDDFLGMTMTELGINDKNYRGQCFTPTAVSTCMAEVMLVDLGPPVSGRTLTLQEPACGGGSMVIAASEILKKNGYYPWHFWWQAIDVDQKCFQMAYIQLSLLGIPAGVIWGNTLTLEQWDSANTVAAVIHPPKKRDDGIPRNVEPTPQIETPTDEGAIVFPSTQLELF